MSLAKELLQLIGEGKKKPVATANARPTLLLVKAPDSENTVGRVHRLRGLQVALGLKSLPGAQLIDEGPKAAHRSQTLS